MKRVFGRIFATIGAIYFVSLILLVVAYFWGTRGSVPKQTLLRLKLQGELREDVPQDFLAEIMDSDVKVLRGIVGALDRASADERVKGLFLEGTGTLGMAQTQELRDALLRFRKNGKFVVTFADSFGEFGPGMKEYYLATAADEVWVQPSGDIGLTGVMSEVPFVRGTLDKLGIVPRLDHRYEYKNAMNTIMEKGFTPAHKEALDKIVQSVFGQMTTGIAEMRKLPDKEVRRLVDSGPLTAEEAKAGKLVDGIGYRDESLSHALERAGGKGTEILSLSTYDQRTKKKVRGGKSIGLIYGLGTITRGESKFDPIGGEQKMGSETVAAAFRQALRDPDIKAVVFRVDSPGGSYVASDTVWRETQRLKKAGKALIVSMGDMAGSGGYFVAMAADKIVAQPGTLTGSIGVLGGKAVTTGFWEKLGLTFGEVHAGAHAPMFSTLRDYSPAEWSRFESWLDRVYADFTTKVAEGRKLAKDKVLEVAKGRVWTGQDAKERGLVDELGGLDRAITLAKKAIGVDESEAVRLVPFPEHKNPLRKVMDRLLGRPAEDEEEEEKVSVFADNPVMALVRQVRPLVRSLDLLDVEQSALKMPFDLRP